MNRVGIIFCFLTAVAFAQESPPDDDDDDDEDIRLPEGVTGRPMPDELTYMFGNKTGRDLDLEVCMGEYVDCHKLKYELSQQICGRHDLARKTFRNICELNYENCKAHIINPDPYGIEGPSHLIAMTVNPEVELWTFVHDGECSSEVG